MQYSTFIITLITGLFISQSQSKFRNDKSAYVSRRRLPAHYWLDHYDENDMSYDYDDVLDVNNNEETKQYPCNKGKKPKMERQTCTDHTGKILNIEYCHSATPTQENARAIFVIHGSGESHKKAYDSIKKHALTTKTKKTISNKVMLIAPRFQSTYQDTRKYVARHNTLDTKIPTWSKWPYWSWGYESENTKGKKMSSFHIMDKLIEEVMNSNPKIKTAVVIGHSAGGQFVQRYALMNNLGESLNKKIHFIVANPSSFAYLTNKRWMSSSSSSDDGLPEFRIPTSTEKTECEKESYSVRIHGADYNRWPFGLDAGTKFKNKYVNDQLRDVNKKKKLKERYYKQRVTYIAGSADVCPEKGKLNKHKCKENLQFNCNAGTLGKANSVCFQGKNRMDRTVNFVRTIQLDQDAIKTHKLVLAPLVAHSLGNAIKYNKPLRKAISKRKFKTGFAAVAEDEYSDYHMYNDVHEYGYYDFDDSYIEYDDENDHMNILKYLFEELRSVETDEEINEMKLSRLLKN